MTNPLDCLGIERAPNDSTKAVLLDAVINFAQTVGDCALEEHANALMPKAHPYKFDPVWGDGYADGFHCTADSDQGVDPGEMSRYREEFWEMKSDAWRQERLQNPHLGFRDGETDAENLNAA